MSASGVLHTTTARLLIDGHVRLSSTTAKGEFMRNSHRRCAALASLIVTALAQMPADAAEPSEPADGANMAESSGIDEIIVTATKRNESLVEVPISMSVFTEQAIAAAGITRAADFLSSTPNVTFMEDNAGEAYINIRGQTSVRNSDPNVAIVIDGVTLSSVKPFNQDLFDIQQIEVLKGPQSALYGRNAAAGAIVITTKRPGDELEGKVIAARGNFDTTRATASIGGPLSDTVKFNLAGSFRDTDGPFDNVTTGEDVQRFKTKNARARLLFDPSDNLAIDVRLGGHDSKGGGSAYNAQLVGLPLGGFDGTELDANNAKMPFVSNVKGVFEEDFVDGLVDVEYDFGVAKLTAISAWNKLDQYFASDSPPYVPDTGSATATVQQYTYLDENYSQELRLTSRSDQRLRWQMGFYYLHFERDQTSKISADTLGDLPNNHDEIEPAGSAIPTLAYSNPQFETDSWAPFASVQFDVTEQLQFNVAGRYDHEKRKVEEAASDAINPLTGASYNNCVALTGRTIDECNSEKTFKQFEPKVSLSYKFTDDANVYVSWGKGFKSGGFNPIGGREALIGAAASIGLPASSVYVQDIYDKEVSDSYELGAKVRLLDRRLALNAAVFQTDIEGAQQFEFYPTVGLQTTISVDKVELKGFDFDFTADLPADIRLFGGYGYVDSEVKNFAGNPAFNGNVAPGAFKTTINLGLTKSFALTEDLELIPRVEFNRYGSIWWDVANTPGTKRDPLELIRARLSLKGSERWEVSAYGDNLTNEKYFQEVVPLLGVFTVNYRGPTRSYGLEARYNF
jgi:iron complex outermembrane recepter protein